jgi:hypothetical protein
MKLIEGAFLLPTANVDARRDFALVASGRMPDFSPDSINLRPGNSK